MITLTMQCSRCGKEVSQDMTNSTLNNELVRKFGFVYTHNGKTNVLLCMDCEKLYRDLKGRLESHFKVELCSFFDNCGKEGKDGNDGDPKNG